MSRVWLHTGAAQSWSSRIYHELISAEFPSLQQFQSVRNGGNTTRYYTMAVRLHVTVMSYAERSKDKESTLIVPDFSHPGKTLARASPSSGWGCNKAQGVTIFRWPSGRSSGGGSV